MKGRLEVKHQHDSLFASLAARGLGVFTFETSVGQCPERLSFAVIVATLRVLKTHGRRSCRMVRLCTSGPLGDETVIPCIPVTIPPRRSTWIGADIDDAAKEIVYRNYVDISVAVSSPNGLVVPVLRNVEDMGESESSCHVTTTVMRGFIFSSLSSTQQHWCCDRVQPFRHCRDISIRHH